MSQRYQGGILGVGFNPLQAPNAPTVGTASSAGVTSASVAFTAPVNVGGSAITGYAVQSTPGGIGATGTASPITVSGLSTGTPYTFRVAALNTYGPSPYSASSNSATPAALPGQIQYTEGGTYSWVVPAGVTSISVVTVGGGGGGSHPGNNANGGDGGGGGALAYVNNISVTPGETLTVSVAFGGGGFPGFGGNGGKASLLRGATELVGANGGQGGRSSTAAGGTVSTGTGGSGGGSSWGGGANGPGGSGGGGAGGYSGNGGFGGDSDPDGNNGTAGSGGGGGGGASSGYSTNTGGGGAGGAVGLLGQGSNGSGGTAPRGGGGGGSGGSNGFSGQSGGAAGTGGTGAGQGGWSFSWSSGDGRTGAVRIIWPGNTRQFPSTNTGNV